MADHPKLICIVGIDGSGKTTLAQRLAADLDRDGAPARYVWCRFESKALARALRVYHALSRRKGRAGYAVHKGRKKRLFSHPLLGGAYERFVRWSYARQIRRLIVRPLRRGVTVVCDRYVYDSAVDLALDRSRPASHAVAVADRFLAWVPKPDVVVHLDVPAEVAFARKDDVPELSYLTDRQAVYEELARRHGFLRVDGTDPPEKVYENVRRLLAPLEVSA